MKNLLLSLLALAGFAATLHAQPITEASAAQVAAGTAGQGYYVSPRRLGPFAGTGSNSWTLSVSGQTPLTLTTGSTLRFGAGTGITLTLSGSTLSISAAGGSGTVTGLVITPSSGLLSGVTTSTSVPTITIGSPIALLITGSASPALNSASLSMASGTTISTSGSGTLSLSAGLNTFATSVTAPLLTYSANSNTNYIYSSFTNSSAGSGSSGAWQMFNNGGKQIQVGIYGTAFDAGQAIIYTDSPKLVVWANNANTLTLTNTMMTLSSGVTLNTTSLAGNVAANGVAIVGATSNSSAATGIVGEFVRSLVAVGSAVALATNTTTNATSITLTAGDWDVEGNVNFNAGSATVTAMSAGTTVTSATVPSDGSEGYSGALLTVTSAIDTITLPQKRFSLTASTTVYLVGRATFSAGTDAVFGGITARRRR